MTLKKLFFIIAALVICTGAARADKHCSDSSRLPHASRKYIKKHFPKSKIAIIEFDKGILHSTDYEVRFTDGVEIDFNHDGSLKKVKVRRGAVPASAVPARINKYVKKHYAKRPIIEIDRKHYGFEVELTGDIELRFDHEGNFLRAKFD